MDTQPTIYVLSDAELDAVTGGKKGGGGGGGGETAEIVEISIGEIVAVGNSTDSASARLPGMLAPAAMGWSARLVWAAASAP